ncbi:MAG: SHOCT domain-containing protein, partial [Gordonia sp. (in: high G+C Gram-positive bacteria)]
MNRRQEQAQQQAQQQYIAEQQYAQQQAQQQQFAQQQPAPQSAAGGSSDLIAELSKLGELHTQGLLTAEEFAAAKA